MLDTFRKIRDLLDKRERRNAVLLFVMMLLMGLLETVGVGSVMPFISVVSNPEVIKTDHYLATVYNDLQFKDYDAFLIFLATVVFILVVGGLAFKALTHWAMARFIHTRSYTLSSRLLRGYLGRPYSFFLNRHSSDLGTSVLSEVGEVIHHALMPAMRLVANAVVAVCLIALVIGVAPLVALSAVVVLGGAYALIYLVLRRYVSRIGAERVSANRMRFQVAQEAFGGIKDVKILGLEDGYIREFHRPASRFARMQANNQIVGEMPKFALQALVFTGMLSLLVGLLITRQGVLEEVLPLIALYTFAGMRLMPAFEEIYNTVITLRFGKPGLDALHKDLVATQQVGLFVTTDVVRSYIEPIRVHERLQLDHIRYTYPDAARPALDDLSLTVPARTTVALVGSTGAGKTTAVDVILGLLEPQEGRLLVDDRPIEGLDLRRWQGNIGYVPQSIFLIDDTVTANIAFGVPDVEIDSDSVERAARIAELHDFVTSEMPRGYETLVGERGVRLSGGQRQRIGIARAIYHDPDLLVLDEATSALDNFTEKAVMDAVRNLGHRKTIILIAHRLSTVRKCDHIFMLDKGRLVAEGTYTELSNSSDCFRTMAADAM